jgi:hypothetical protein
MKREIRDKWVAALRSGRYKQGRAVLKRNGTHYCCLGVLAEIEGLFDGEAEGCGTVNGVCSSLPKSVLSYPIQDRLMSLNDHHQMSFTEIADQIESLVTCTD